MHVKQHGGPQGLQCLSNCPKNILWRAIQLKSYITTPAHHVCALFPLAGVPIPEQHAAAGAQIEVAIQTALQETQQQNIKGSNITPYLLQRIQEITSGASLTANIQLVKNNAKVGSQIAAAFVQL